MIQCHRCGEGVTAGAEFCARCGAPQLYLAVDDDPVEPEAPTTGNAPPPRPSLVDWPAALVGVSIVSCAGLLIFIGAEWSALLGVLAVVCVLSAGQLAVDLYRRRRSLAVLNSAVGARIGAAVGLGLAAAKCVSAALTEWLNRYPLHKGAEMDAQYKQGLQMVQQMTEKLTAQPLPADQLRIMASDEYHAASALLNLGFACGLILFVAVAAGALTGLLHARRRVAS